MRFTGLARGAPGWNPDLEGPGPGSPEPEGPPDPEGPGPDIPDPEEGPGPESPDPEGLATTEPRGC